MAARCLGMAVLVYLAWAPPAFAYLDPGSAYILIQVFGAIGAGVLLMFRRCRRFFVRAWARALGRSPS